MIYKERQELRKLIEKIELVPQDELGVVFTQNNMGHNCLWIYGEAYVSLGVEDVELLLLFMKKIDLINCRVIRLDEFCGTQSTKRNLLDYLNSFYLLATGNSQIKKVVKCVSAQLFDRSNKFADSTLDKNAKNCLFNSLKFLEYKRLANIDKENRDSVQLSYMAMKRVNTNEYDFTLFSDFHKNFKPYKQIR